MASLLLMATACLGMTGQVEVLRTNALPDDANAQTQVDSDGQLQPDPNASLTPDPNLPSPPAVPTSNLAIIGRAVPLDPNSPFPIHQGQPNVAMGVHFRGSQLSVTMSNPHTAGRAFFNLRVDGVAQGSFAVVGSTPTVYPLAKGLDPAAEHVIWWTRRNEPLYTGQADLHAVDPGSDGELLTPPEVPSRRIEMLGASVELGWCCLDPNAADYSDSTQDATLAWPQLAADLVDAALVNTSMAGEGMHWTIGGNTSGAIANPNVWTRVDLSDPSLLWDPNTYPMTVVFIDLIANDWTGVGGQGLANPTLAAQWQASAIGLTDALYQAYPGVSIYFISSATYTGSRRDIQGALMSDTVAKIKQAGQDKIGLIDMPYNPDALSCCGHPTPSAHQAMGQEAAARLKKDLNW